MFTELKDRKLWYDGSSSVDANSLSALLGKGVSIKGLFVEKMTPEIERFNKFTRGNDRIWVKNKSDPLNFGWNIPKEYLEMDVIGHIFKKFEELAVKEKITGQQHRTRLSRIEKEINLYLTYGLENVLQTIIYIVDTFKEKNVVWGVGRGSSVSSYVLYVLGVHDIDSVHWNLDIEEFLKKR